MHAKLVTYNSQNNAGTLGSGLILLQAANMLAGKYIGRWNNGEI